MTDRLSHKRDCLYKDKITWSKSHLFVLEKAEYTTSFVMVRDKMISPFLLFLLEALSFSMRVYEHAFTGRKEIIENDSFTISLNDVLKENNSLYIFILPVVVKGTTAENIIAPLNYKKQS